MGFTKRKKHGISNANPVDVPNQKKIAKKSAPKKSKLSEAVKAGGTD